MMFRPARLRAAAMLGFANLYPRHEWSITPADNRHEFGVDVFATRHCSFAGLQAAGTYSLAIECVLAFLAELLPRDSRKT
jgi:hypothetical protein